MIFLKFIIILIQKGTLFIMYSKDKFYNWVFKDYFIATILVFILAIIPIIVNVIELPTGIDELTYTRFNEIILDSFSYFKSVFLIVSASILAVFFIMHFITSGEEFPFKKNLSNPILIATLVFLSMTLLTFIFSKYKYTNIHGYGERYENIFVLFSYFIIFFTTMCFVSDLFRANIILYALLFSSYIISFIGISQMLGNDFFLTDLGSKLILGKNYNSIALVGVFKDPTTSITKVYGTLFNPNCVGLYTSLTIPLTFISGIFCNNNLKLKCLLLIASVLNFIILIGSGSVGGFFAIGVAFIFAIAVTVSLKYKPIHLLCILIVPILIIFFIPPLQNQFKTVITKFTSYKEIANTFVFKDIKEVNGNIELYYKDNVVKLSYDNNAKKISILDENNNEINPISADKPNSIEGGRRINFDIPNLGETSVELGNEFFTFEHGNIVFIFTVDAEGIIIPISRMGQLIDLNAPVESIGFTGKELFASSRGYIWSRSLPYLKNTILIGAGVDSFAFIFPQNDMVGKLNYFGNPHIIVDKPHNFFLQTALNTGVISLLALLFIFGFYIINTLKLIFNSENKNTFVFGLRFASLVSVFSYLVSALSTDSVVSVSPVFWAVLGFAFAVNKIREV